MYIAIIWLVLFAFKTNSIWKKKGFNLASSLYALFALSFLSSALMGVFIPHYCDNILIVPSLYLLIIFYIWFEPFNYNYDIHLHDKRNKILANTMLIIMIPTLLYFLYYFRLVLMSGLLFVDDNIRATLRYDRILPGTTITSIAIFFSSLYFINIFLFYIGLLEKWGRLYNSALFISSLAFPIYCLCFFGRDGVVLWLLNVLVMFMLFRKSLPERARKSVVRVILVFMSLAISILVFISITRFFNPYSDVERNLGGTLGYLGQQLGNFSDVFYVDFNYAGSIIPGFSQAFSGLLGLETNDASSILEKMGLEEEMNIFRFFVSTLTSGYGYVGGILVSLLFSAVITSLSKKSFRIGSNLYLLIILVLYQIPMNGVFYFRQGVGRLDIGYAIGIIIMLFVFLGNETPRNKVIKT